MTPGKVKYKNGLVGSKNHPNLTEQVVAWREDALCGCGPNCCDNMYHWTDVVTSVHYVEYVMNGAKVLKTYADFLANGY